MFDETEKFTFFWSGPFSQWHKSSFKIDGVTYNCAEQYMMAQKAMMFEDLYHKDLIMKTQNPRAQKAYGREVKGFVPEKWQGVQSSIVYNGNHAKFTQNAELKEMLLATAGTTLVEASPYDVVWGIGLTADDPRAQNRATWLGENKLGYILTRLRDQLL